MMHHLACAHIIGTGIAILDSPEAIHTWLATTESVEIIEITVMIRTFHHCIVKKMTHAGLMV